MFSEAYISYSVGDALISFYDPNLRALSSGYVHPQLAIAKATTSRNSGRKSEIDYVVHNYASKKIEVAIETKWAASSHCSAANVLWDLVRLKLIKAQYPEALCGLVIAGHPDDIAKLFKHRVFKPGTQHPLRRGDTYRKNFRLLNNKDHHKYISALSRSWFKRYPKLALPDIVTTQLEEPSGSASASARFVCYAWRVL